MRRAHRLLTIYTQLLRQKRINKYEIAQQFQVNDRTVQRDLENIRSFLADSDEYFHTNEVRYDHLENVYYLKTSEQKKDSAELHMMLIRLYAQSPIINPSLHQLLKQMIHVDYGHDAASLNKRLERFKVSPVDHGYSIIQQLEEYIETRTTLNIETDKEKRVLLPMDITYRYKDYYLVGRFGDEEILIAIRSIRHFIPVAENNQKSHKDIVTLEMTKALWHQLKDIYPVEVIEIISEKTITVSFLMSMYEVLDVCLIHSPDIRIISGSNYSKLINHLLRLNAVYFNQTIMPDE